MIFFLYIALALVFAALAGLGGALLHVATREWRNGWDFLDSAVPGAAGLLFLAAAAGVLFLASSGGF